MTYWRPVAQTDRNRPAGALPLAGGWAWWDRAERLERGGGPGRLVPAQEVPAAVRDRICAPRADLAGLDLGRPRIMGILNATPDSFSDGGQHAGLADALARGQAMVAQGADIIDIGGESTRPGAAVVPAQEETERVVPVIAGLRARGVTAPISLDTRKASVARAGLSAGADVFNDVSALTFDAQSPEVAARSGAPVCLMHAQGDPRSMQDNPAYEDVLLDVYDFLETRIAAAEAAGIARARLILDPGIGFGKTIEHNLALLRGMSLFHALGCPILLGVSRKGFIGVIGNAQEAAKRAPGSIALGLEAIRQGVQVLRVHDVGETKQALSLWQALL